MITWRLLLLLPCLCLCTAEDETAPAEKTPVETTSAAAVIVKPSPQANPHRFEAGELRIYHYEATQQVIQQNLDDHLNFKSLLRWRFGLRCAAVDAQGADLVATIFLVQANHEGPGSQHTISSSSKIEQDDPILGHLLALNGTSLRIRWEDGQVASVDGSESIIAAMAGSGVDADRRHRAAAKAYSPEALLAFWRAALMEPTSGSQVVPLAAPLEGQATRTWDSGSWKLKATSPITATLATKPAPLVAEISKLTGEGWVQIDAQGILQQNHGTFNYRSTWSALGQPAIQDHKLQWQLILTERRPPR